MTTTISIPTSEYNRAKVYAKERNLSIDELVVALLGQLTSRDEDAIGEVWMQATCHTPMRN